MPLAAGTRLGAYEILAPLGKGGMGEVFRARDAKLERDVAIKVLTPAFANNVDRLARFQREAKVLASLNHPNIATVYALEDTEHGKALVMELVEGSTAKGPMPVEKALKLALQVADAIEAAHDQGIVHRDIKPSNVMVTPQGNVKVLDFGLAAFTRSSGDGVGEDSPTLSLTMTEPGVILGTAAYMSPEQASGETVDRHADIWSFGVLLTELLTGERLFQGPTVAKVLANVINQPVDLAKLPADTPAPIRELIARCLEREVRDRLHAMGEARIAIQKWLANPRPAISPSVSQSDGGAGSTPRRSRLIPVLATATVALALSLGGLSFAHFREKPPETQVLRYPLVLPENSNPGMFALSPDGKFVAIIGQFGGKRQLYLRPLDALQGQPMASTDNAIYPFWSPDSRYIAFFADGKLKKVPVTGGPSQSLCDVATPFGGTWGKDNVIVFSPAPNASLQRVSAAGGTPMDIFKTKGIQRYPVFLPDGRRFLYWLRDQSAETSGIYLASLDGKENRRLLADDSGPVLSVESNGSAHILFVRENTLMAQPFDIKSGNLAGEVFPVADGVALTASTSWAPASVSERGTLLFENGGVAGGRQLTWFDRGGKALGTVGAPGAVFDPAISPDEKTVAYSRASAKGGSDLWLRDLTRETDTRFTSDASQNGTPVWSPKGDRIAFVSDRSGSVNLYQKSSSGTGQDEEVYRNGNQKVLSQWSHDGRWLVYSDQDPKLGRDLSIYPIGEPAGPNRKPTLFLQTQFNESQGQISPDGHWMSYTSTLSGAPEVYVQPFPSGEGKWKISVAGGNNARWRGDGKELFYVAADYKMMAVAIKSAVPGVKPSFEAATPQALFDSHMPTATVPLQYDVTADGKRFLVNATGGPDSAGTPPLTVVVNWLGGVKK